MLVHAHRHAEIVLREGVVRPRFDQQRVHQVGVRGQRVLEIEQATADQAGAGRVVFGVVGAAHTGTDLRIHVEALAVDDPGAVTQTERTLAVVGGEIVALVTHGGGDLAVFAQLQRAAGTAGVAVGGGVAAADGGAVVIGIGVLRARAQAEQVHAVHPVIVGVAQAQTTVEALGIAVAAGRGKAQFTATAAPGGGHRRQFGNVLCINRRGAEQQGNKQRNAQGHQRFSVIGQGGRDNKGGMILDAFSVIFG